MRSEGEARRSHTGRTGSVPARRRVGLRKESGDLLSTLAAGLTVHPDPGDLRLRRRRAGGGRRSLPHRKPQDDLRQSSRERQPSSMRV